MRRLLVVPLVCALALVAGACGGDDSATTPTPDTAPVDLRGQSAVQVEAVKGNLFVPARVIVSPGTTVTWVNKDTIAHNVKAASQSADFGSGKFGAEVAGFGPGASYAYVFANPGVYDYVCTIHTGMVGSVRVEGTATTTSPPVASSATTAP